MLKFIVEIKLLQNEHNKFTRLLKPEKIIL
jgi:hypothetical protein